MGAQKNRFFEHPQVFFLVEKKTLLNTLIWGHVKILITFLLISLNMCFGVQTRIIRESDYSPTAGLFMQLKGQGLDIEQKQNSEIN